MRHFFKLVIVVGLWAAAGCGPTAPKGPTYNEALQTYEAEQRIYDRLDKEAGDLVLQKGKETFARLDRGHRERFAGVAESEIVAKSDREEKEFNAIHAPKLAKVRKEKDAQRVRVEAAKKVVDDLRASK